MSYTPNRDFLIEVQKGNIPGHRIVHKFGRNDSVPNGSWQFVNQLGFTAWPLSAPTTVRGKAGDAADTAAGAGAREITIRGIDSNFNEIDEAVATAGASASANTSASFWRVHRAWVSAVGTSGAANTGNVIIENSGGGTDLIQITADEGQTQFGGWTVPIGKTAYVLGWHVQVDATKPAKLRLFTRADIDDTAAPMKSKRLKEFMDGIQGQFRLAPRSPGPGIAGKSDLWAEAFGEGAMSEVAVDIEILVVDD